MLNIINCFYIRFKQPHEVGNTITSILLIEKLRTMCSYSFQHIRDKTGFQSRNAVSRNCTFNPASLTIPEIVNTNMNKLSSDLGYRYVTCPTVLKFPDTKSWDCY